MAMRTLRRHCQTTITQGRHQFVAATLLCVVCAVCVLISGCDEPHTVVVRKAAALPDLGHKTPWASAACTAGKLDKDTVACVDGVSITVTDYRRVAASYPDNTPAGDIVSALVNAELLAADARKNKLWANWLLPLHQQAMVRTYLADKFEKNYTWEDVAQADLHRAWRDWGIRIRFLREPSYFATDAQFLCCSGDWRKCEIDQTAIKCIDDFKPQADALYEILKADPPRSPLEMKGRVYAMAHNFPKVAITDINFYYLPDVPHEEQIGRGYTVMVKEYAKAVVALKPGEISRPIRTPFGWHITRLQNVLGQLKGKLSDPHVRKEIAENILSAVRRRDTKRHAFELMKRRNVKVHFDEAMKKS